MARGAPPKLSAELCKQTLELFQKHHGNKAAAARGAGVSPSTFFARLDVSQKRYPKLAAKLAPKPATIEQEAEAFRAQETERTSAARLKDALREIGRLGE